MATARFVPEVPIKRDVEITMSEGQARFLLDWIDLNSGPTASEGPVSRELRRLLGDR